MATRLVMPKLGLTAVEATVVRWLKAEGDRVEVGEPVVEIMTEKVTFVVESPASGVLLKILVPQDQTVPVGTPIAVIGEPNEDISALLAEVAPVLREAGVPEDVVTRQTRPVADAVEKEIKVSPAARRLACELGVDLSRVQGTGPGGRITSADVERASRERATTAPPVKATPLAQKVAEAHGVDLKQVSGSRPGGKIGRDDVMAAIGTPAPMKEEQRLEPQRERQTLPFTGMRRTIAERMLASARTTAPVMLSTEVEVERLVALREELRPYFEEKLGVRLTYTDLIIKAVAVSLTYHPYMNATLTEEGIVLLPEINIGMATAVPNGLLVPVIRNADRKSLVEIARETKELARRAREGTISIDDLKGGTFTVTNLGAYGIDAFSPIINLPEAAILGVGRIREKPAVENGQVAIKPMMHLSLVFDHRLTDGAQAAEFLARVAEFLRIPALILAL